MLGVVEQREGLSVRSNGPEEQKVLPSVSVRKCWCKNHVYYGRVTRFRTSFWFRLWRTNVFSEKQLLRLFGGREPRKKVYQDIWINLAQFPGILKSKRYRFVKG